MKHSLALAAWSPALAFLLAAAAPADARADAPPPRDADALVQYLSSDSPEESFRAAMTLEALLRAGDKNAEDAAAKVLAARDRFVKDKDVAAVLTDDLGKKPVLAARLVVAIVRAQKMVANFHKGSVVVGRVVVEDGKTDPEDVLAQMPILPEGYFAGEVGDLKRPICFRTPGCEPLDVPLEGKSGNLVYVGSSALKPLKKDDAARLKGNLTLDAAKTAEGATLTLSMMVGPVNTPHNGYSPRAHWPQGIQTPIAANGTFDVEGLTPGDYRLSVEADAHVPYSSGLTLKPGEAHDAGTVRLHASDVGFYIGKPAPKVEKLAWEKDYAAALARAKEEKKPILIMLTATWCGWCRKLEADTLDDPWVRYALSDYVVVQAYQDKGDQDVVDKYGADEGFPTLVFADSTGKMLHKSVGYMTVAPFLEQCARADKKLGVTLPPELQTLVDKQVISIDDK